MRGKIKNFPDSPGVYLMRNAAGKIIYVGKATSLRERVGAYFARNLPAKTAMQMREVKKIDYLTSESALEALILEANLIKKYAPKFNMREKDDKSRVYVHITREKFPRLHLLRETDLPKISEKRPTLYGPFFSGAAVAVALGLIRKIVPFRSCNKLPKKRCLYGHLGLCEMPCERRISKQDYARRIRELRDFFEGKKARVTQALRRELKAAASKLDYEKAAQIRDRLSALEHLKQAFVLKLDTQPTVFRRIEGYDISNISGAYAVGSMVVFLDGESEKSEYRKFRVKSIRGANDVGMLKEVLTRRFRNDWPHPDLILVDGGHPQVNAVAAVLKTLALEIPVVGLAKGPERKRDELITSRTLPRGEIALFKRVRDEAHRFAKGYYQRLHRKSLQ